MRTAFLGAVLFAVFALLGGGCAARIPREALEITGETLANRQLQSRRFSTQDEMKLLSAASGLAQDLGFAIESSQSSLGFILASKDREATEGGQVVGAVLVSAMFGTPTTYDTKQKIRLCMVTKRVGRETILRATFQRIVWNNQGQVSRLEFIGDEQIYRDFFTKMSKAVFLEAQQL